MERIEWNENWTFMKKGGVPRTVELPHDAMLEEKREAGNPSGSGCAYFAGGAYCYEKKFRAPEEWSGNCVKLQFEGVYRNARVSLNGMPLASCGYGYLPFWAELPCALKMGAENVLTVEVNNEEVPNSRWYSGAGIYRSVWLWVGNQSHIETETVRITTLSVDPVQIRVECSGHNLKETDEIRVEIPDDRNEVTSASGNDVRMRLENVSLWSAENPKLYECRISVVRNGMVIDSCTQMFGIRQIAWSSLGFFVNGRETLLKGGCIHHDNGILGACSYKEAELRRVRILKEAGFNAIRSAHNPAGPDLLEACDRLGMYLIDEAWDMWYIPKTAKDYSGEFSDRYREDLKTLADRDYNHPCVVMYSIGNEVTEPAEEKGNRLAKEMTDLLHELDSTRAVTIGLNLTLVIMAAMQKERGEKKEGETLFGNQKTELINSTVFNETVARLGKKLCMAAAHPAADELTAECLDAVDIAGYNYASVRYSTEPELHPDRVIVGTETYPQDIAENWKLVEKYPYVVGDFMWTAWDYIGEAGIGAWSYQECSTGFDKPYPWLLADTGAFDILGNPTGEAALASAVWKEEKTPYLFVKPVNHPGQEPARSPWRGTNSIASWSWSGCEGNEAEIEVYTGCPEVELFVNGTLLGRKKTENHAAVFRTVYVPGTVEAVAYDGETESGRRTLMSADGDLEIRIIPEKDTVGERQIFYADILICGENGEVESNADAAVTLCVSGGTLLGFGSANPRTEESFKDGVYTTCYGRSLAAIRAGTGDTVRITAVSPEYTAKTAEIKINRRIAE